MTKQVAFKKVRCGNCEHIMRFVKTRSVWSCTYCPHEISDEDLNNPQPVHDVSEGFERLVTMVYPIIEEPEEPITPLPVVFNECVSKSEPIIYEEPEREPTDAYDINDVTQMFKAHPRQQPIRQIAEF